MPLLPNRSGLDSRWQPGHTGGDRELRAANPIGIHSLVWVGDWGRDNARWAIASSAEAGFEIIELAAMDPTEFDADFTARLLAEYGMRAVASLGLDDRTDV
jgi:D-psicose/D-tagatose/L-ribulose 3-epimerase